MLLGKLLTNRAAMFSDVRTYWSGEAVKRVTGYDIEGKAKEANGFLHLINSGASALDFNLQARDAQGNRTIKPFWELTDEDIEQMLAHTTWNAADLGYFRGGGYSSPFITDYEAPMTMIRLDLVHGFGPLMQHALGRGLCLPPAVAWKLWKGPD